MMRSEGEGVTERCTRLPVGIVPCVRSKDEGFGGLGVRWASYPMMMFEGEGVARFGVPTSSY